MRAERDVAPDAVAEGSGDAVVEVATDRGRERSATAQALRDAVGDLADPPGAEEQEHVAGGGLLEGLRPTASRSPAWRASVWGAAVATSCARRSAETAAADSAVSRQR